MPPKAKMPAPIDRPLSRAYLRQFKGWSTAYPPGVSDPASLRIMENLMVNRDGSVKVRPGLRNLTRTYTPAEPVDDQPPLEADRPIVGSFEPFYLNDGTKAYLFAVRNESAAEVQFRVATYADVGAAPRWYVKMLTSVGIEFNTDGWASEPHFSLATTYVKYLQIDNKILALSNSGEQMLVFYVGATKKIPKVQKIDHPTSPIALETHLTTPDWINGAQTTRPPAGLTNVPGSLSSSNQALNVYNLGFFFTYGNALGESAPSEIFVTHTQRPFGSWLWEAPTADNPGEAPYPNGTQVSEPHRSADTVIVNILQAAEFDAAVAAGATHMNLYMLSWSQQSPVPVEGQLLVKKDLTAGSTHAVDGWFSVHPGRKPLGPTLPLPTPDNRYNSTDPSRGGQGIVAADRLVVVHDPTSQASIKWTSNQMGDYLNFASSVGGGYKTLTSGNMQVPACVKLWQNPQSVDTLTVLCRGTDGHSSAYYMAPAAVTSQSDNVQIMGFEETTATPGTTSPYGCEVANNALYHPLDDQLMKSTASNYNINHKSMTDLIANRWAPLLNKDKIVSCFFDQRLYLLVHNPDGEALETHCNGNEVWVLDLASEGGTWSRWLVQGVSMKKVDYDGRNLLALVRPDGIFVFDETKILDEYITAENTVDSRVIPWRLETNTQGANRAHDAWAHLRQVSLTTGNFEGVLRFGIRGKDLNGKVVDTAKLYHQEVHTGGVADPFDAEDHLRVARELKEWFFYAESVDGQLGSGQISLVQYRYTPVSVNVGYDWGTVESFEYGRAAAGAESYTDNGVPQPYLDTARP